METHDDDPTTEPTTDPWDVFRERFGGLGDQLRSTYRDVADDKGPTETEIKGAFSTLAGAWDQIAESVSSALQDPDVRERLKDTASSLASAVGSTISDLGAELKDSPWRPTSTDSDEEE